MPFNLDFTNDTEESLDQGGWLDQPGWYLTEMKDTYEDDKSGQQVFELLVTSGPFKGGMHFERLTSPDMAKTDDTRGTIEEKAKKWASRLGAVPPGGVGEIPWENAIGKQWVIELEDDSYVAKNGDKAGQTIKKVRCKYLGIYAPTHQKIPAAVRTALGLPPALLKDGTPAPVIETGAATTDAGAGKRGRGGRSGGGHNGPPTGAPAAAPLEVNVENL